MVNIGDTVYTVRGDTNTIDTWKLEAQILTPEGEKAILKRGTLTCILPSNCVFETREEALEIANRR